ncbi:hypothetical protein SAMN05444722_1685 [Rhodovulum sp. ES.010]|uniref:hypothetical protein n=1 Tax=Rhodovulum sp. ES.010 TaxID=1882821 RepID=UPI000928B40D|nr:hypothetical protein [Rhodovulum sp. ES.010]SIO36426.1 hypothetical protein SAMN05444722_1685 [Rhodovulum sp. ES.010]
MRAAAERRARDVRELAYATAALIRAQRLPAFEEWIAGAPDRAAAAHRWAAAWDRVGAALARNRR